MDAAWLAWPLVHPLQSAIALLLLGALVSLALARRRRASGWAAVVAVGLAGVLLWAVAWAGFTQTLPVRVHLPIASVGAALVVRVDALSAVFLAIVATIGFLSTLFSVRYMDRFENDTVAKFYPVLQVLFAAIVGVVVTADMLFFLVFWELMTLASFFLVVYERENPAAQRAGLKYFVVNQAAALGMLAGTLLLWRVAGSFGFAALRGALGTLLQTRPVLAHVILLLFFMGFATKAGVLPMGSWLPDAYPAAPSGATAAFGGTMTKLGVYGILRVFLELLPLSSATTAWGVVIATAGVASLFIGTLTALAQDDVKRLMSFHVIGQVGYMYLGIGMGLALLRVNPALGALGLLAGVFHMVNHSIYKSCLFLGAGAVEYRTGTRSLAGAGGGLGSFMAVTAACALIASLAIAGIPPLNGFASKWLIYATGILGGGVMWLLPLAALVAMFISLATLASFLKYLGGTFLGQRPPGQEVREVPISMLVPQACLALLCLAFGLVPMLPLMGVHRALAGLASAGTLPALTAALGSGPGLALAQGGLGAWAPLPIGLGLLLLSAGAYLVQRAGRAARRTVPVWTCGEIEPVRGVRYVPGSYYRPFKDAFHGVYPSLHFHLPPFPAAVRRFFEPDRWLYFPLARGADRAARGVSRTHVGLLQVYLLWVILGAIAVLLLLLLVGGGS